MKFILSALLLVGAAVAAPPISTTSVAPPVTTTSTPPAVTTTSIPPPAVVVSDPPVVPPSTPAAPEMIPVTASKYIGQAIAFGADFSSGSSGASTLVGYLSTDAVVNLYDQTSNVWTTYTGSAEATTWITAWKKTLGINNFVAKEVNENWWVFHSTDRVLFDGTVYVTRAGDKITSMEIVFRADACGALRSCASCMAPNTFANGAVCVWNPTDYKCVTSFESWEIDTGVRKASKCAPTTAPTRLPTVLPTKAPTMIPTANPTNAPTMVPTSSPTIFDPCFGKKNVSSRCAEAKFSDFCSTYPAWMNVNCDFLCCERQKADAVLNAKCNAGAADIDVNCGSTGYTRYCTDATYKDWMSRNCARTCCVAAGL